MTVKYKNVLLKKFGTIVVNKIVKGQKFNDLWYIYFWGDWHYVPKCDVSEYSKLLKV